MSSFINAGMDLPALLPPERSMLCSVSQSGEPGPYYISPWQVALGAAVILVNALVSLWLKLDMHWQLAVGAIRQATTFKTGSNTTPLP